MKPIVIQLRDEADTSRLGQLLEKHLPASCLVALDGTLGAGKTRLVRAIAEACGVAADQVTSPTFALWQTYHGRRTIHHLDAYRIQDEDEFEALGVEECYEEEALTLIEWASRVEACLPPDRISVYLEVTGQNERLATISGPGPQALAEALQRISR